MSIRNNLEAGIMVKSIEFDAKQVLKGIKELSKGLNTTKKPIRESLTLLKAEQQDNFTQQGAIYQGGGFTRPEGKRATTVSNAWAPLAASTKRERARVLGPSKASRPILIRTGRLKRGFRITNVTDSSGKIENTVPYAPVHQKGKARVPQRMIMGISDKSGAAIRLIFVNYVKDKVKKSGLA